jgi:hypothetical protein
MGRSQLILGAGASLLALAGCTAAGTSGFQNTTPEPIRVESRVVVDDPFDTVWDHLVGQLSNSSYLIEKADKASQTIDLAFSTDHPEEYADCGSAYRTYTRDAIHEEFRYQIAESASYKVAGTSGAPDNLPMTQHMTRRTNLEGRVNVRVAPEGAGTLVAVNCKYLLTITTSGMYTVENVFGAAIQQGEMLPSTNSIDFTTAQSGTDIFTSEGQATTVTCQSTGRLESEILDMVRLSE